MAFIYHLQASILFFRKSEQILAQISLFDGCLPLFFGVLLPHFLDDPIVILDFLGSESIERMMIDMSLLETNGLMIFLEQRLAFWG